MSDKPVRILLIEDNPGDARLIREMLAEAQRGQFDLECADRLSSAIECLADGGIDVVLSDLSLPDSRGLETFARVCAHAAQVPIIILSGIDDENMAVEAVREGAQDYLVKGHIDSNLLVRAIRYSVERKRAQEEAIRYTRQVEALHAIAAAVSHTVDLEQLLDSVLDKVLEVTAADAAQMMYLDVETGMALVKANRGLSARFIGLMGGKIEEEDLRRWLRHREPTFGLQQIFGEPVRSNLLTAAKEEGLQSFLGVPLWSKDVLHGGLLLASRARRRFSSGEVELLQAIASEIAVGIENAKLFEKAKELAVTDELTGLYNRRHFYVVLETEISRIQRYGRFFSLVIIDLDGFKPYNDNFGHNSGDRVLQSMGQILRSSLRRSDTAFRYGGDEFAIILPATDARKARKIVHRIRSKWSQVHMAERPALETSLGFSAGIAQFPDNAEIADGLVFLADTALYRSKKEGGYKSTLVSELGMLSTDVLDRATLDQVYALAATVDSRDAYTYGHSKRVATLSEMIGRAIGLSADELTNLHAAGLVHDIGKIGVPDSILTKPVEPTKDEWKLIRKHSAEGARIVSHVKELASLIPAIRHHHEWLDGTGYPDGLKGDSIPLGARIISIADAYDTMTTKRTYRNVVSQAEALEELRRCSHVQFDPELVEAFSRVVNHGEWDA